MNLKLIAFFPILIAAILYSYTEYQNISRSLNTTRCVKEFALRAEKNLKSDMLPISNILSEIFNIPQEATSDESLYIKSGFAENDTRKIMDYSIKYNYLNHNDIILETQKLIHYAEERYSETQDEFQKRIHSLICPHACVILLIMLSL